MVSEVARKGERVFRDARGVSSHRIGTQMQRLIRREWTRFHYARSSLLTRHDASRCSNRSTTSIRKVSPKKAVPFYSRSADFFCSMGRLGMAGKAYREAAEQLESCELPEDALSFYEKAADLFETENQASETNKCKLKMASMHAELGRELKAVSLFEDVAKKSVDNNLLKYSVKGYLLQAGLCHLGTGDCEATQEALERYEDLDVTFSGTRECEFLQDLLAAVREGDTDQFTAVVTEFDSMTRLDAWKTRRLLKAKQAIENGDGEDDLT